MRPNNTTSAWAGSSVWAGSCVGRASRLHLFQIVRFKFKLVKYIEMTKEMSMFSIPQMITNWDYLQKYIPFYDAYQLWQQGSDYILSEGYQRSKQSGLGVIDPLPLGGVLRQLPFVSWVAGFIPRIYVVSGTKTNLETIAEYGEHIDDKRAREPHDRVKQATDATTIVNLLGNEAKIEKQKIRKNLSSKEAFQCAKELGSSISDIWDDNMSLQDNITYVGATIIGQSFLGINEFPRHYVPLIRKANDLIADGDATTSEFAEMKSLMMAMSDDILGGQAHSIIEANAYVRTQFTLDGNESLQEATQKLTASHSGAGFLVESNLSFLLMLALAHISNSPLILKQLSDEIQQQEEITIHALTDLEYLDCIYRETIRFASATAVVPRIASVNSEMNIENTNKEKSTCAIYPNSHLFFAIRSIHHDPALWKEPQLFNPLRFIQTVKDKKIHFLGENYFPFSAGKRACPAGTTFVEYAFKGFVFEFFKRYSLKINQTLEDIPAYAIHPRWKQDYFARLEKCEDNRDDFQLI